MPETLSPLEPVAASRSLRVESAVIIERARALCWRAVMAQALAMRGGSDAALVTSLIADARLCLPCISRKTGVPNADVNALLLLVARTFRLQIGPHRCDACLEHKTTFSVTRDGQP